MSLRHRLANFIAPQKNAADASLARDFLQYGNRNVMTQNWSQLRMSEEDKYTGYGYAAIEKRANGVAKLARENLKTDATQKIMTQAKAKKEPVEHPYLVKIDETTNFGNTAFWHDISVYVDLAGIYYLGVVRAVAQGRVGNVVDFMMMNPYKVVRVTKIENGQVVVGGYREFLEGGFWRDWPVEQIIPFKRLNPFKPEELYAMSDAATDSQFTLKSAGDYTRHALAANANAPGIYSTDVQLPPDIFNLFKSEIRSTAKGEPIIANGAGAVTYDSTQIKLNDAALDKVAAVSIEPMLAVTGTSKTGLGIEQSGVTRDTAKVMSDQFISDAVDPQLTFIADALNQDFKRYYPDQYKQTKYRLFIDSPLGKDRDAEAKDIEIRTSSLELYQNLVNKGYDRGIAARFAQGEITLEELGEPTNEPILPVAPVVPGQEPTDPPQPTEKPKDQPKAEKKPAKQSLHTNALGDQDQVDLAMQQASLQQSVEQVEERVALAVLNRVTKNAYDQASDVIDPEDEQKQQDELEKSLLIFLSLLVPVQGRRAMTSRTLEQDKPGTFSVDSAVQRAIGSNAKKAAASHMATILEDLRGAVKQTMVSEGDISRIAEAVTSKYPEATTDEVRAVVKAAAAGGKSDSEIASVIRAKYKDASFEELLAGVRESALAGAGHDELVKTIRAEYAEISKTRASVIAKTETNRAFALSQYQADRQFLVQNDLMGQAYKKWVCRGPNPCVFCLAKQAEPAVPFEEPFAKIGDVVTARSQMADGSTKTHYYKISYENVDAGDIHPLGNCGYALEIR